MEYKQDYPASLNAFRVIDSHSTVKQPKRRLNMTVVMLPFTVIDSHSTRKQPKRRLNLTAVMLPLRTEVLERKQHLYGPTPSHMPLNIAN